MLRNFLLIAGVLLVILALIFGPKLWDSPPEEQSENALSEQNPSQEKPSSPATQESSSESVQEEAPSEEISEEGISVDDTLPEGTITEGTTIKEATVEGDEHTPSSDEDANIPPVTEQIVEGKIEPGDSLLVLFEDYSDVNSAYALVDMIEKEFSAKSMRVGQPYLLEYDAEKDTILRFEYEINSTEKLIVTKKDDAYVVAVEEIHYDKKLAYVDGSIDDSLYLTIARLDESPQLAHKVADMFRYDVNFIRDVQKGDSFSILVEKLYREDEFKGYGRTLGATFTNKGKKFESFLYYDANKKEMHYNADGENLRKVLLQSPLKFTRVTSGYTHSRKHPVYGTYRPHLGIDYGAPMGTPIMAVGDGTVTYVGWRGGYGKHIIVRHAAGLESLYSHLSRYARKLKKGTKVKQGETIGYVGSTGVSTGPHLDFRLKQNGKFINPSKAINPRAEAVSKVHKKGYDERKKLVREFMDGTRSLKSYDPTSVDVPK